MEQATIGGPVQAKPPTITLGRFVHYQLSAADVEAIQRRRTTGASIRDRMDIHEWPRGAQAHIGNVPQPGEFVPMLVVRVWPNGLVNGQAFLDGNDVLWVTSAREGSDPGEWSWPPRV